MTPGLLATDRVHLAQSRKKIFAQELAELIKSFKLYLKGERDKTRLARGKPGGSMPM